MKALHVDLHFIFFLLISASLFSAFGVLIYSPGVLDTVEIIQMCTANSSSIQMWRKFFFC